MYQRGAARLSRVLRLPGFIALLALVLAVPTFGQSATRATPGFVRVAIETSAGRIVVALDQRHAPKSTANFLAYVDDGRLDGTSFYRASRRKGAPNLGFVQGGIGMDARRRDRKSTRLNSSH